MKRLFWGTMYWVNLSAHGLAPVAVWQVSKRIAPQLKFLTRFIAVLILWIIFVMITRGCPFSYIHQYIEVKMGKRQKVIYTFKDSRVARHIVAPLGRLTRRIISG